MGRVTVMIVEDEAIIAFTIRRQLTRLGYDVVASASHADEAIDLAGRLRPDIVLMDIHLAGVLDGVDTARTIRETLEIPVIFLTASANPATIERAKRAEPYGYIVKPFAEHEAMATIEIALYKHQAEQKVHKSEAFAASVLDSVLGMIAVLGRDGTILAVNRAWNDGLVRRGGQPRIWVGENYLTTLDQPSTDGITAVLEGRVPSFSLEYACHSPTSEHWFQLSVVPLLTQGQGVVVSHNEVTERKLAEQKLEALAHSLIEAERRVRNDVANILHDEVQQLLVAARMHTTMDDMASSPKARQVQELLTMSLEATRTLTSQLSPPGLQEGDILAALHWLARSMQKQHGLKTTIEWGEVPELTASIREFLFSAIRELLFNVVKHAKVGEASVWIATIDHTLVVKVRDGGIGFRPGVGGSGLQTLSERLRLLGGTLEVSSSGETCVSLTIPLVVSIGRIPNHPISSVFPSAPPDDIEYAARPANCRILLVDDHVIFRESLASMLTQQADFSIVGQASNGLEAVSLARQVLPNVVLIDYAMPIMDGLQATRILMREWPETRVVGLSMHIHESCQAAMFSAGACGYLSKESSSVELIKFIRRTHRLSTSPRAH